MKIWMFQSLRNFIIGIIMLIVIVLLLIFYIGSMLETAVNDKYKDQTFDEFKEKYVNEQKVETSQKSNYFIDTNGYIPKWAKNIGEEQALGKCMNIFSDNMYETSSPDYKWCNEFSGFLGDKLNQQMNDMGLK